MKPITEQWHKGVNARNEWHEDASTIIDCYGHEVDIPDDLQVLNMDRQEGYDDWDSDENGQAHERVFQEFLEWADRHDRRMAWISKAVAIDTLAEL